MKQNSLNTTTIWDSLTISQDVDFEEMKNKWGK